MTSCHDIVSWRRVVSSHRFVTAHVCRWSCCVMTSMSWSFMCRWCDRVIVVLSRPVLCHDIVLSCHHVVLSRVITSCCHHTGRWPRRVRSSWCCRIVTSWRCVVSIHHVATLGLDHVECAHRRVVVTWRRDVMFPVNFMTFVVLLSPHWVLTTMVADVLWCRVVVSHWVWRDCCTWSSVCSVSLMGTLLSWCRFVRSISLDCKFHVWEEGAW